MIFIILACCVWSIDTLIRYPLTKQGVGANHIVMMEHLFLAIAFFPQFLKRRQKFWNAKVSHIFYFLAIGGLGSVVATMAFTQAFNYLNPSIVILFQKLQPLVAIILARILLKEKIQNNFLSWAFVCLIGGFLISFEDMRPGFSSLSSISELFNSKSIMGYGLTFVAVLGWGSAIVFGKMLTNEGYSAVETMTGRFLMGFVCISIIFFGTNNLLPLNSDIWLKVSIMALLSGAVAMYLYYSGLKLIPARVGTIAEMFWPLAAIVVNWVFLGETLGITQIIGGILLILGATMIQIKKY